MLRSATVAMAITGPLLLAGCVASTTVTASTAQANRSPLISAFTANPGNEAKPGQAITFLVAANDPDSDPMQFNWTATGGMLSTNAGQAVTWTPPTTPGTFSVQVVITDGKGGAALGAQNITVAADKVTLAPPVLPSPPPAQGAAPPSPGGAAQAAASSPATGPGQPSPDASPKPKFRLAKISTGLPVRDFQAFDMNEVWAAVFNKNQVLHTEDGGVTWDAIAIGTKSINGVYFQDRMHGWACGNNGVLFETKDGGKKWELVDVGTDRALTAIVVKPDGVGYITWTNSCGDTCSGGGGGGTLVTRDGGKTWKPYTELSGNYRYETSPSGKVWGVGGEVFEESKGTLTTWSFGRWDEGDAMFFEPDGTPWFVVRGTEKPGLYRPEGESLVQLQSVRTPSNIYRDLQVINATRAGDTVVLLTEKGMFRSDDAGKTWNEPVQLPNETSWLRGRMTLFGPDKGWVNTHSAYTLAKWGLTQSSAPDALLYRIGE